MQTCSLHHLQQKVSSEEFAQIDISMIKLALKFPLSEGRQTLTFLYYWSQSSNFWSQQVKLNFKKIRLTQIFTETDSFRDISVLKLETSRNCPAGLGTSRNCPAGLGSSRNCPAGLGNVQKLPRRVRNVKKLPRRVRPSRFSTFLVSKR